MPRLILNLSSEVATFNFVFAQSFQVQGWLCPTLWRSVRLAPIRPSGRRPASSRSGPKKGRSPPNVVAGSFLRLECTGRKWLLRLDPYDLLAEAQLFVDCPDGSIEGVIRGHEVPISTLPGVLHGPAF
jgi:hypothetical protein